MHAKKEGVVVVVPIALVLKARGMLQNCEAPVRYVGCSLDADKLSGSCLYRIPKSSCTHVIFHQLHVVMWKPIGPFVAMFCLRTILFFQRWCFLIAHVSPATSI